MLYAESVKLAAKTSMVLLLATICVCSFSSVAFAGMEWNGVAGRDFASANNIMPPGAGDLRHDTNHGNSGIQENVLDYTNLENAFPGFTPEVDHPLEYNFNTNKGFYLEAGQTLKIRGAENLIVWGSFKLDVNSLAKVTTSTVPGLSRRTFLSGGGSNFGTYTDFAYDNTEAIVEVLYGRLLVYEIKYKSSTPEAYSNGSIIEIGHGDLLDDFPITLRPSSLELNPGEDIMIDVKNTVLPRMYELMGYDGSEFYEEWRLGEPSCNASTWPKTELFNGKITLNDGILHIDKSVKEDEDLLAQLKEGGILVSYGWHPWDPSNSIGYVHPIFSRECLIKLGAKWFEANEEIGSSQNIYDLDFVGFAYNDKTYNYDACNILTEEKTIDIANKDTKLSLLPVLQDSSLPVGGMTLVQTKNKESKVIATSSSSGEFKDLKVSQFQPDGKIFVYVYDTNHKLRSKTELALRFVEKNAKPSKISFGDGIEIEIGSDLFGGIFKGRKIKTNAISCPITWEVSDNGTLRMGLNIDLTDDDGSLIKDLRSNGFTRKLKRAMLQPGAGKSLAKAAVEPSFDVVGYAEGSLDSPVVKGKLYVEAGMKGYKEFQVEIFVGEVSFSAKGKAGATFSFDPTQSQDKALKAAIDVGTSGKVGLYGGVGVAYVVSAGIYANATANVDWRLTPYSQSGPLKFSIKGEAGVKLKGLGRDLLTLTLSGSDKELILYQRDSSLRSRVQRSASASMLTTGEDDKAAAVDSMETLPVVGTQPGIPSAWMGANPRTRSAENDAKVLKTNVYQDAQPRLISCNGKTILFFLDSDSSRDEGNRSKLVYSILDENAGIWSSPVAVWDNKFADFSFDVFPADDSVDIVWQKSTRAVSADEPIGSVANAVDLAYAKLDPGSGVISDGQMVTANNGVYEMMPRVARNTNGPVIAWVENSQNSILANQGFNVIQKASYAFGSWNRQSVSQVGSAVVTSLDAGMDGDDTSIAWTVDEDGNLNDLEDTTLYSDLRGEIEAGYTANALFTSWDGRNVLTASVDGGIYDETSDRVILGEGALDSANYDLVSNGDGSHMIVQLRASGGGSELQVRSWDSENRVWSDTFDALSQDTAMPSAAAAFGKDGPVFVYIAEDSDTGAQNLMASRGKTTSVQVDSVEFPDGSLVRDGRIALEVQVRNASFNAVDSFNVQILDSEGNIAKTVKETSNLAGGETATLLVDLPIENEDGLENLIYQARVEGSNESVSFDVSCANLALEAKAVIEGAREKVSATVTNEGSLPSQGAKLRFYNWDTGELLSEESLPVLGAGEAHSVEFGSECLLKDLGLSAVGIEIIDAGVQSSEYDDDALVAVWSGDGLIQENYAANSPGIDDTDGLDNPSVPGVDDDSDTESTPPKPNRPLKPGSSGGSTPGVVSKPSTSSKLPIAKASVSVKSKTYNGKAQKCAVPTVKVGGKALRYKTDFTYSCKAGKKIGSYKVTVKGAGKYAGTKTATFKIVPKGTSIAKLSKAKKAFTVKWKKPSKANLKQTTGYQVRWSTSKKFTKKTTKTKTVKATSRAGKTCQLKVAKLKAKKKYYVQVRTYKKVGGKTYYSSWSKAKAVKTKR